MKKALIAFVLIVCVCVLSGCNKKEELYVINVGDYINDELIAKFEKENNCDIVYEERSSNEEIYQRMTHNSYDVAIVSDYMIDRLYQEGKIAAIDYSKTPNYDRNLLFQDAVNLLDTQCSTYENYFVPYFWGTVGILYNTNVKGLEDYVKSKGLKAIFSDNAYVKGMYNSARDALCMAVLSNGGSDINTTSEEELNAACQTLRNAKYAKWGDDTLKTFVHDGQLDLALVYSGDYLDQCYLCSLNNETINFGYYAPDVTNIWIDGMVVLKNAKHEELAYKFLNFMSDASNSAENANYIGYCPLSEVVFNKLYDEYDFTYTKDEFYPYKSGRLMYRYVSSAHYALLNDLLEQAKAGK